jgi:RNA polymerase sigma factor (sigma-70 family)
MRSRPDDIVQQQGSDFVEYLDGLYGYAMILSRNRTEAEDLVQETYRRVPRAINRLHDQSNVRSWLFTVLRDTWLSQVHRQPPELIECGAHESRTRDPSDAPQEPHAGYSEPKLSDFGMPGGDEIASGANRDASVSRSSWLCFCPPNG